MIINEICCSVSEKEKEYLIYYCILRVSSLAAILFNRENHSFIIIYKKYFFISKFTKFDAGLLAKKAVEAGLSVEPYIKTSLSPGSGVVTYYLEESGVIPYLTKLGFDIVGYGCMTCIGNSGPLPDAIVETIEKVRYSEIIKFRKIKIIL